ncbi:endonuclease/exonuclease/phosphatase family protein [Catenulispora pinisilvae]|uniref:endonuclease/exonuclease/phosphatase family protein n=1 Tax=Catenulispora pinisilvae TaxID=2705253 RepID=UPI0018919B89|nr:endonuclease/exonuclease/phosphatase family protein [Catenulispora pinisilvae]
MPKVRVLSFNTLVRGEPRVRLRALAEVLADSDYDVVCLQELWIPPNFGLLRSLTKAAFPYAAHGPRLPRITGGLLTLSRIPLVGHRYEVLAAPAPWRRDLVMRRGVLMTRFNDGGEFFTVTNTHLTPNRPADWSKAAPFTRVQQAELARLAKAVRRIQSGEPVIAVGDFNVPRDSWLFEGFAAASGLRDAFDGDAATTFRPVPGWDGAALDQVLVTPGVTAKAEVVLQDKVRMADGRERYLSDHYGVAATIG